MKYSQHSKNAPNRLTLAIVSLLSAMALTACGGGGGGSSKNTGGSSTIHNGNGGTDGKTDGKTDGGKGNPTPTPTQPTINELVVTTLNDVVNAKDDVNSLREAVNYASKHGGTITFKDDLKGKLTLKNSININNSPKAFSIKGKGDDIKIDGNNLVRLFEIKDSTVTFDNLILQNANVPSNNRYYHQGGAAIHARKSNINLNNIKLLKNKSPENAGGAIYAQDSNISIIGGEMTANEGYDGGAIYSGFNNKLSINSTKFDNNTCVSPSTSYRCYGGAIAHTGLDIDITGATFKNNIGGQVIGKSDGSESMGGAVFLDINKGLKKSDNAKTGNATITNSTFSNNLAGLISTKSSTWGGAIMINSDLANQPRYTVTIKGSKFNNNISANGSGGAIELSDGNTLNITGSTFSNNQSQKYYSSGGGAINVFAGNLSVKDSSFIDNKATSSGSQGGAIEVGAATTTKYTLNLDNITFKNNTARSQGGAVYLGESYKSAVISNSTFEGNKTNSEGGGLHVASSDAEVKNTNFINNSSRWGGGMFVRAHNANLDTVTFKNNKVSLEGGGLYYVGFKSDILTIKNITTSGNTSSDNSQFPRGEGIYCHCKNVSNKGGNNFGDPNVGI